MVVDFETIFVKILAHSSCRLSKDVSCESKLPRLAVGAQENGRGRVKTYDISTSERIDQPYPRTVGGAIK
jgi:hypothetical protein